MSSLNHPALGNLGNKTDPADQVQAAGRRPKKKKATLSRSLVSKALILGRSGPSEEEQQNPL